MPNLPKFPPPTPTLTLTNEEISYLILHQKSPSEALQTFKLASTDASTLHSLIRSLLASNRLRQARDLLLSAPRPPPDASVISLIRALARARRPRSAIRLIAALYPPQTPPPPLKILNSALDALAQNDIDLVRAFFRRSMPARDHRTYGILMKGLCGANRIAEAFKLLRLMKSSAALKPNAVIYNTLLHALCRLGKVGRARSLMSEMPELSDVILFIMISAYCAEGNLVQALVMLEKCFEAGFVPDAITATKVVDVLCAHGRTMEAVELLERVESAGGAVDAACYNCLIKWFCRMEKPEVGRRVVREMERKGCLPNVHTYNVLLAGFADGGKVDSAMDVCREMAVVGVRPEFETFDALIRGFCSNGRIEDGLKVLDMMEEESRHQSRVSPYNSVLYGFYKEERIQEGCEFFERMKSCFPRVVERSLRILGFCGEGRFDEGKVVYDQMVAQGDSPNALVYGSLIEGLSAGGNVREAFELMNEMIERGYLPVVSTFNALIRGFCEEGNVGGAKKLLEEMVRRRCNVNAWSYNPLIGALCREGDVGKACALLVQMVERGQREVLVLPQSGQTEVLSG